MIQRSRRSTMKVYYTTSYKSLLLPLEKIRTLKYYQTKFYKYTLNPKIT